MKIDELTGEVIEEDTSLVKKEMNALITDELLDQLVQMKYLEEQIEIWKFKNKETIKELFKKFNIKSFENDYIKLTYVAPTHRKSVDTQKLKDAGLYDKFLKVSDVEENLRIKLKEGND